MAWLQPEPEDAPREPGRRKVRASERAAPTAAQDAASLAIVAALQRDAPLMAALWPDVRPAELLRSPPPVEAFQARCDFARRAIDAVGRRDAEARAQAELAQRRLADQHLQRRVGREAHVVEGLRALPVGHAGTDLHRAVAGLQREMAARAGDGSGLEAPRERERLRAIEAVGAAVGPELALRVELCATWQQLLLHILE